MSTLVTIATDGFRDFVDLPDGRTFNMGSVSVLKLITTLVPSGALCRQALDSFLKDKHATVSVDLAALEKLLQPKRSRWAGHENRLISPDPRNLPRGASTMNPDQAQAQAIQNQVAAIETHIGLLEQTAKEHAVGSQSQQQVASSIETLKKLVADLAKAPSGQSKNDAFYVKMGAIETHIANFEAVGANPESIRTLQFLAASMSRMAETTMTKEGAIDEDAKTELQLYMDNESRLDRQKQSILQNILRKMKSGRYDHNLVWKLWMYWVDEGAKAYTKEFGGDVKTMFPKQLRESLAKDYADDEKKKIEDGEYSHIKVAVEAEGPTTMPPEVQKAEDVAKGKVDDPYKGKDLSDNAMAYKLAAGVEGDPEEVANQMKADNPYAGKDQSKNDTFYKLAGSLTLEEQLKLLKTKPPQKVKDGELFVIKVFSPVVKKYIPMSEHKDEGEADAGLAFWESDHKRVLKALGKTTVEDKTAAEVEGVPEQVAKQMGVANPYAGKDLSKNDTFYKLAVTDKDKKVIDAFIDKKKAEGTKLTSDGKRLDGAWMGGNGIAEWDGDKIKFNDLGSKAAESIQKAVRKMAPTNLVKGASEEVLVNEALATSLMAKVEGALNVVQASSKANTDLAKKDLHIISSKLATVLQESELSDPTIRPNLLGLASMADKIQSHFAS